MSLATVVEQQVVDVGVVQLLQWLLAGVTQNLPQQNGEGPYIALRRILALHGIVSSVPFSLGFSLHQHRLEQERWCAISSVLIVVKIRTIKTTRLHVVSTSITRTKMNGLIASMNSIKTLTMFTTMEPVVNFFFQLFLYHGDRLPCHPAKRERLFLRRLVVGGVVKFFRSCDVSHKTVIVGVQLPIGPAECADLHRIVGSHHTVPVPVEYRDFISSFRGISECADRKSVV